MSDSDSPSSGKPLSKDASLVAQELKEGERKKKKSGKRTVRGYTPPVVPKKAPGRKRKDSTKGSDPNEKAPSSSSSGLGTPKPPRKSGPITQEEYDSQAFHCQAYKHCLECFNDDPQSKSWFPNRTHRKHVMDTHGFSQEEYESQYATAKAQKAKKAVGGDGDVPSVSKRGKKKATSQTSASGLKKFSPSMDVEEEVSKTKKPSKLSGMAFFFNY